MTSEGADKLAWFICVTRSVIQIPAKLRDALVAVLLLDDIPAAERLADDYISIHPEIVDLDNKSTIDMLNSISKLLGKNTNYTDDWDVLPFAQYVV